MSWGEKNCEWAVESSKNKHYVLSELFAGIGSKRKLLEEMPKEKYVMNGAVDGECNSDQHSNGIVIPSINSEEKIPSSVADLPLDGEKTLSDDVFQVQSYIPSNGMWKKNLIWRKRNLKSQKKKIVGIVLSWPL